MKECIGCELLLEKSSFSKDCHIKRRKGVK